MGKKINLVSKNLITWGLFWEDRGNRQLFMGAVATLIAQILVLVATYGGLPNEIPMYFSLPWGDKQLSNVAGLLTFPIISMVIVIINGLLAVYLDNKSKLVSKIVLAIGLTASSVLLVGMLQIIRLVY